MREDGYRLLPHGITLIDTGYCRAGLAACYMLEQGGQLAFIDTGTMHSIPRLLRLLEFRGLSVEQVAYIIPTHVHLDHAGGVGGLMQCMPNARLVVHPRGARHLIDPAALQAGAMAVYGEQAFRAMFGQLVPVDASRVLTAEDGFILDLNGRSLVFRDTPGHARHHFCIYDALSQGIFTGDTFGVSYPELEGGILPTTTPVQFEPQVWCESLNKLAVYQPEWVYLTHFGPIRYAREQMEILQHDILRYADVAKRYAAHPQRHAQIKEALQRMALIRLRERHLSLSDACILEVLDIDLELNAQGLVVWLERQGNM